MAPDRGAGIAETFPALRAAFEAARRNPANLQIVPFGTVPSEGKLSYYASLGIREVVLHLPSAPRDRVLATLDEYSKFL